MSERQRTPAGTALEGVAIIAMAGRFPGARSVSQFWENLRNGVESITTFTEEELLAEGVDPVELADPDYVKAGAVVDGADRFDAAFFGYSPREAEVTDPQQRLFLECASDALESAGYDPTKFEGLIGVYGGLTINTYLQNNIYPNRDRIRLEDLTTIVGNDKDYLATRVAYKLDLRGPAVVVQSACSTSLVAIHLAADALLNGECDLALAGGVTVTSPLAAGYLARTGGIYSPDGHCRPFDANAHGTVFGNGAGIVVLKRIEDAVADGDCIRAVIKGSAVNNDGALKIGYTAPSIDGQEKVVAEALSVAGVEPDTIGYVEAHGTGTVLGDPIEVTGLTRAFRRKTSRTGYCAIGSVKGNIGHLNSAAGVTSLIKTVLMLEHRQIPPSLHCDTPNPKLDLENSPFRVNTTLTDWTSDGTPLRAGVSSFGVGGTNAHVVLEQAPVLPDDPQGEASSRSSQLVVLSARTSSALEAATANLGAFLRQQPGLNLGDIAYTLSVGRRAMSHRRVLVCGSTADAAEALRSSDPRRLSTSQRAPATRPVTFMFTGQGAQYVGMGRELYDLEATFRQHVDECTSLLQPHLGLDLREILFAADARVPAATARLTETALAQPALFTIEYAMARLLMSWGVEPEAMIGHSIGEYVAACLAGVFTLEAALRLVAVRGRLMNALPAGAMMAVPAPEADVREFLTPDLSLAAVNSPSLCVLSGTHHAIDGLEKALAARGLAGRRLHTSHAFHSAMMEPALAAFTEEVSRLRLAAPAIPYLSNLTGTWVTASQATDPKYWAQHLRQTVRFSDGVAELLKAGDRILVEVGPGETLATLARRRRDKAAGHTVLSSLRPAREQKSDQAVLLGTIGELWLEGVEVNWTEFYGGQRRRRVPLPTYPFERQRFWLEPPAFVEGLNERRRYPPGTAPARRQPVDDWFSMPVWKTSMPARAEPASDLHRSWLLLADTSEVAVALEETLKRQDPELVTVRPGSGFSLAGAVGTIRPDHPDDYGALLDALDQAGQLPTDIVHMWTAGSDGSGDAGGRHVLARTLGFHSLVRLVQALGKKGHTEAMRLTVVSRGVFAIDADEALNPDHATLLGPCRTIPFEYPNITCRLVDLARAGHGPAAVTQAGLLATEITSGEPDAVVALRGRQRWVQSLEPVKLPAVEGHPGLRQGGVYLITGGWGGIGLVLARHLARTVQARLIMVGRSALPARADWGEWLSARPHDDAVVRRIMAAQEIESLGGEVLAVSADVTDPVAMRAAVEEGLRRFGALNGVVHAAGMAGGGMIQLKDPGVAEAVLAPKVTGTWVLDEVLAGVALDWWILYSSTFALTSQVGQVDYCAANAFLDAFAHYRSARDGAPTISINWDGWQEVGMAADAAAGRLRSVAGASRVGADLHPLLGQRFRHTRGQLAFRKELRATTHWALSEHRVGGTAAVPGTAYLEMVRAALPAPPSGRVVQFSDVVFTGLLAVADEDVKHVYTVLDRDGDEFAFTVVSSSATGAPAWREHVRGRVGLTVAVSTGDRDVEALRGLGRSVEGHSRGLLPGGGEQARVVWGPHWQVVDGVRVGDGEVVLEIALPNALAADLESYVLHPALLDVATGAAGQYLDADSRYLPLSYDRVVVFAPLQAQLISHVRRRPGAESGAARISFDVTIFDATGKALVEVEGFTFGRADAKQGVGARGAVDRTLLAPEKAQRYADLAALYRPVEARTTTQVDGIGIDQGLEAFDRILGRATVPQIAVSVRDLTAAPSAAASKAVTPETVAEPARADLAPAVDPGAGPSGYARPDVAAEYVEPTNESEQAMAAVWQESLGIDSVGVNDNFFELGGDSVVAIQIVAKAIKAGFRLEPQHIFEFPTVAELARAGADDTDSGSSAAAASSAGGAATSEPAVESDDDFGWSDDDARDIAQALKKLTGDDSGA